MMPLTVLQFVYAQEEEGAAGSINGGVMIYTEMPRLAQFLIDRYWAPLLRDFLLALDTFPDGRFRCRTEP
jgi:hypothetical protein